MVLRAWQMKPENEIVSQFDLNYAGGEITPNLLESHTGVTYHTIDVDRLDEDAEFKRLKSNMGITYQDNVVISPQQMPNYADKLKIFYAEHLHADDEIRLILDGSGYFDVRNEKDQWVRINVVKGDLITLPAGIYHRFTTDDKHFVNAMRLFVGDPVWTPINRPADDHFSRLDFLKKHPISN